MYLTKKTEIPGPKSKIYLERLKEIEAPNLTLEDEKLSITWESANNTRIIDVDGNEYIDFASGLNVANVGHANPHVTEAVKKQLDILVQGMGDFHPNKKKVDFLEKLSEISPIKNNRVIVSVNGSDAIDSALKTASLYTGKSNFISFFGGYHGMGAKSLEVTARTHFKKAFSKELNQNTTFVPYPYCYRCPFGKDCDTCEMDCLSYLQQIIENEAAGTGDIAGVIIESVQGRGGVVDAPKEFLVGLREICDRNGILLIMDEILSGFGRTGEWYAFQHAGIEPDIVAIGKGLSSGYPISACIGKKEIMDQAWGSFNGESIHTSTFQGNPIGSTFAEYSIDYIQKNDLIARSREIGEYFQNKLKTELSEFDIVGDIRGKGLMIGIEFIKNKITKEEDPETCWNVMRQGLENGLLLLNGGHKVNVLCLTPPLTISKDEIDFCIENLKSIITKLDCNKIMQ